MSNFRRRSRFRRELIEKQPQESLTFASLGSRLAAFKYAPDPELESKHRLENCGNIFIGACSKCTVHSASTFLKDSLSNFACMQNSLEGRNTTTEPSKASSLPAEIDFQEEISNHRYVRCEKLSTNRLSILKIYPPLVHRRWIAGPLSAHYWMPFQGSICLNFTISFSMSNGFC